MVPAPTASTVQVGVSVLRAVRPDLGGKVLSYVEVFALGDEGSAPGVQWSLLPGPVRTVQLCSYL